MPTMNVTTNMYSGPGKHDDKEKAYLPTCGVLNGDYVKVLWKEKEWLYIEFNTNQKHGKKQENTMYVDYFVNGYVLESEVSNVTDNIVEFIPNPQTKYLAGSVTSSLIDADGTVLREYVTALKLPSGMSDEILKLGKSKDGNEFIEYHQAEAYYTYYPFHYRTWVPKGFIKNVKTIDESMSINKITSKMMRDFGWNVTDSELVRINSVLERYQITDTRSIRLFMATCGHESGKGNKTIETSNDAYFISKDYSKKERGAGYIQLTWRSIHLLFLESVNDKFNGADTASYIAENYPWEAAAWFWSSKKAKSTSVGSINDYVVEYGDSKGVFLITQCWVGGWPDGFLQADAVRVRDGQVRWSISDGKLHIENIAVSKEPKNWNDRIKNYDEAMKIFK